MRQCPQACGEWLSPLLSMATSPEKGNHFVSNSFIPLGTVLVLARGYPDISSIPNTIANMAVSSITDDLEAKRIASLCPASIDCAPANLLSKFAGDIEQLQSLATQITEAVQIEVPVEHLRLVQLKLDCNMFEQGLFPLASFFNHSCAHNCSGSMSEVQVEGEDCEVFEVRAVRTINQGEDLCINYLPPALRLAPMSVRRDVLQRCYYFDCTCHGCRAPAPCPDTASPLLSPLLAYACHTYPQLAGAGAVMGPSELPVLLAAVAGCGVPPTHWLLVLAARALGEQLWGQASQLVRDGLEGRALPLLTVQLACTLALHTAVAASSVPPHDPMAINAAQSCADSLRALRTVLQEPGTRLAWPPSMSENEQAILEALGVTGVALPASIRDLCAMAERFQSEAQQRWDEVMDTAAEQE